MKSEMKVWGIGRNVAGLCSLLMCCSLGRRQFNLPLAFAGLESDICKIIDGIVPWIREHGEMVADDDSMRQLRDELLQQASRVCFPEGAAPSDLFKSQLSTIVDGTLSQYVSSKLNDVREELIFDISEILYNELAFFQLMFNINNLVP